MTIRSIFLEACDVAHAYLSGEEMSLRWHEPSALQRMTVGDLAGHLVRAVTSVVAYLDRPAPEATDLLDAPGYFLSVDLNADLDSDLHVAVRRRAAQEAEGGQAAMLARWRDGLEALRSQLDSSSADRTLAALEGRAMLLDDYLITRLVEIVAHTDDLAASLDAESPAFANEATGLVIDCMVTMARRTHRDLAVVRALIRRERDLVEALRVF